MVLSPMIQSDPTEPLELSHGISHLQPTQKKAAGFFFSEKLDILPRWIHDSNLYGLNPQKQIPTIGFNPNFANQDTVVSNESLAAKKVIYVFGLKKKKTNTNSRGVFCCLLPSEDVFKKSMNPRFTQQHPHRN